MERSATTIQDLYQIEEEPNPQEKEETLIESNLGKSTTPLLEEGRVKPAHKKDVIVDGLAAERRVTPSSRLKPTNANLTATVNKMESTEAVSRDKNKQMPDEHDMTQAAGWVPLTKDHHVVETTATFLGVTEATATLSSAAEALTATTSWLVIDSEGRSQSWVATNGVLGLCAATEWAVVQKQVVAGDGSGMAAGAFLGWLWLMKK